MAFFPSGNSLGIRISPADGLPSVISPTAELHCMAAPAPGPCLRCLDFKGVSHGFSPLHKAEILPEAERSQDLTAQVSSHEFPADCTFLLSISTTCVILPHTQESAGTKPGSRGGCTRSAHLSSHAEGQEELSLLAIMEQRCTDMDSNRCCADVKAAFLPRSPIPPGSALPTR